MALAWLLIALSWTPAILLVQQPSFTLAEAGMTAMFSVLNFLPWLLATPSLIALCRRFPLGTGASGRSLLVLTLAGVAFLPTLQIVVAMALALPGLLGLDPSAPAIDPAQIVRRTTITALFAVPTYVAVIAIGQTVVAAERARLRERMTARVELKALRAELNPHFLFNTLGAIAQLAHEAPDRAEAAIGRLADVLRAGLAERSDLRPLAEEIAAVEEHLALHRLVVGPAELRLDIHPALGSVEVPTHVLQPLAENATTHGGAAARWLRLAAAADGVEGVRLVVENPRRPGTWTSKGLGSGLDNVRGRLAMLYGEAARLEVDESDPALFRVVLHLPLHRAHG